MKASRPTAEYRTGAYKRARELFQTGSFICHICGERPGLTPDHDPPLSSFSEGEWRGTFKPACQSCQSRQGQAIAQRRLRLKTHWRNPNYP